MTTKDGNGQKIRCFWETLEEFDERQRKMDRKRAFLRLLRRIPVGAGFELDNYRDVWSVYNACRLAKRNGEVILVSVRKTNRGIFKIWVRERSGGPETNSKLRQTD